MSGWWFVGTVIAAVIMLVIVSIRRQLRQGNGGGDGFIDQAATPMDHRDLHGHIEGIFRHEGRPT
jgi:hypothetical protein